MKSVVRFVCVCVWGGVYEREGRERQREVLCVCVSVVCVCERERDRDRETGVPCVCSRRRVVFDLPVSTPGTLAALSIGGGVCPPQSSVVCPSLACRHPFVVEAPASSRPLARHCLP